MFVSPIFLEIWFIRFNMFYKSVASAESLNFAALKITNSFIIFSRKSLIASINKLWCSLAFANQVDHFYSHADKSICRRHCIFLIWPKCNLRKIPFITWIYWVVFCGELESTVKRSGCNLFRNGFCWVHKKKC